MELVIKAIVRLISPNALGTCGRSLLWPRLIECVIPNIDDNDDILILFLRKDLIYQQFM